MARLSVLRRGAAAVLLLASAVRCAKPRSSGFAADLASVAEGDAHHGYAAGAEAAELFSLGSPAAAGAALSSGHSLAQLRGEDRRARAQSVSARAAIERSQHEGSAISLALNRKLAVLPESEECKCARHNGWTVVAAARAQVLREEAGSDAPAGALKDAADECPCRSALVSAVTQVLQEKLETLTEELGSRTSAALALQRALVSMRLPDALAGELTHELDQSLAKRAKKKTGVEEGKAGNEPAAPASGAEEVSAAAGPAGAAEPDAINVIVNNNMGDSSYNVTFSDALNQSLPYFYGYKYPPAYVRGGQVPFDQPAEPYPWEGGDQKEGMNVIVNVNNYIIPKYEDPWGTPCHTSHCVQMRASGQTQLRASKSRAAARQLQHAAAAAVLLPHGAVKRNAKESSRQRALEKKLDDAVEALRRVGGTQGEHEEGGAATPQGGALEAQRQRLVATARTLEGIARRKAAAIREQGGGAASRQHTARGRGLATKARMTSLFQLVPAAEALASGTKKVSEADVLSHVDEWEEAQRSEMHQEDGFHVISPSHGDMAAASGRGYDGARENDIFGGRASSLVGGKSQKVPDMSQFDVHSMLGHRGGLEEESGSEASQDLMGFYHELAQRTKKKPLKHGPHNLRIGDGEARDDLGNYYDDEAAREGAGHGQHKHDALYDLAVYGKARAKHALHRESAGQARSELTGFYQNLGRGFPKISPDRPRFKSTGEARHALFGQYFASLTHEGRGEHTRGRYAPPLHPLA